MEQILLTLPQAISLIGITACLVVIIYLGIFCRKNLKIIIIPELYFISVVATLISVFLKSGVAPTIFIESLNIANFVSDFNVACMYLLIMQLIRGIVPGRTHFLVVVPPLLGELVILAFGDKSSELNNVTTLDNLLPLYRVITSLIIFAILTYFVSREFKWKSSYDTHTKHKYWLIIHLIIFNVIFLTVKLIKLSDITAFTDYYLVKSILISCFIYLIISSMFRVFTDEFLNKISYKQYEKPQYSELVKDLAAKIEKLMNEEKPYLEQGFDRAALAKMLHLQETQVSYIVNNHFQKSFTELANEYRIKHAKKLLEETNTPITTICYDTGFNSLTSFNRVFKIATNQAPSEYRASFAAKPDNN